MLNLIECNIPVIPKIITLNTYEDGEDSLLRVASELAIEPSYIIAVRPEKDELTVEQIHQMQKDIQVSFTKKVLVVLFGFDSSSSEVQNSLLKSLEEDSERIQFLFPVLNAERIIPTVLSRCTLTKIDVSVDTITKSHISDAPKAIFIYQNNTDSTKEQAVEKIDYYLQNTSLCEIQTLRHILFLRKLIEDNNMNPVLALDSILIFISKTSTMKSSYDK